ncbi:MAG: CoA-binding protein, partial [Candidatus Omnitrophica bacterium]|nr:CoA-binding protein [Candidatus Omnitrophota bacterium]
MLKALLEPKVIAVIGASRTPGKVGYEILRNLKENGFCGDIVPINLVADEVCGIKCYQDLKTYKKEIDLAVIAIPVLQVKKAVKDSIDAGAKAIAIITAGFKEIGGKGLALEEEIARLCSSSGVRLLGPNCLGLINVHYKMNASFAKHMPLAGGISVISQSGALCTAILDWAASRRLGLSKLISMGNKADLSEADFIN